MKRLIILVSFLFMMAYSYSQNLIVEGVAPNLYINHTVFAKENYYSIGRLYNQSPKTISEFNNLTMEKGLSIGQKIKIPLNAQNFESVEKPTNGEVLVPLKHVVAKGENIFKIGTQFNATAISIREWNLLSSDIVAVGAPIIIGRLKVKAGESKLASGKNLSVAPVVPKPTSPNVPKELPSVPVKEEAVTVGSTPPPAPKKNDAVTATVEPKKNTEVVTIVHTPAKNKGVENSPQVPGVEIPSRGYGVASSGTTAPPPITPKNNKTIDISTTPASTAEGAFSNLFAKDVSNKSLNKKSGEAATFKSTSGWQDRKYYVLMNDVAPGTILKLQSGNSKVIYAKVLGSIPEMKENNGLLLRVSNAAASYLGILDARFPIEVSFYQ